MDHLEDTYTVGMTDEEVFERFQTGRIAVLALAHENDAYAVPVSYAFEDWSLYLRLSDDGHSKQLAFAGTTEERSLVLHDVTEGDSWSIVVEGHLRRLPPEEGATFDATRIDDAFDDLPVFDESSQDVEVVRFELSPDRITGHRTGEHG